MAILHSAFTLCAELVAIERLDANGGETASCGGVLEEIHANTAVLWVESPLKPGDELSLNHRLGTLTAIVKKCVPQSDGFLADLAIADQYYLPKHALLIAQAA